MLFRPNVMNLEERLALTVPVAVDDLSYIVPQGATSSVPVLTNDTDSDGFVDPSTLVIGSAPTHGTAVASGGVIRYTPTSPVYTGHDTFTYRAKDNSETFSNFATVILTIAPNQAPVAVNDAYDILKNSTSNVLSVLDNDSDPDRVAASTSIIAKTPSHGSRTVDAYTGKITYTPTAGYTGPDSFTYTVKDNNGLISNSATVSINVTLTNVAPVAVNDSFAAFAGLASLFKEVSNDTDTTGTINPSTLVITHQPANGTATKNASTGEVSYTPTAEYIGPDSFTYTVKDTSALVSNEATVTLSVLSPSTYTKTSPTSRGLSLPASQTWAALC